jgi:Trp operon repressor
MRDPFDAALRLLTLLLGSTERGVLIAKVQEIQRLLDPLLNPKKTKV